MSMPRRPALLSRRGSLMLLTLMFMSALAVLSTTFIFSVINANRIAEGQLSNKKAFYVAETGLNRAMWYLLHKAPNNTTNGSWRTTGPYPAATGDISEVATDGSIYTMRVQDYTPDSSIYITASSTVNQLTRTVYQRVNLGPVGWWKFEKNVKDSSVYGNNGTWSKPSSYAADHFGGKAGNFTGTNYVTMTATKFPLGSSERTVSAWIKFKADSNQEFVSYGGNSADGQRFALLYTKPNQYGFEILNAGGNFSFPYGTNWHHLVAVVPAGVTTAGGVIVYFDGVQKTLSYIKGSTLLNTQSTDPVIGTISGAHGSYNANGYIDDVRIYNKALSAAEITLLYAETLQGHTAAVVPKSWGEK